VSYPLTGRGVDQGWLEIDGKHPINPSGGLIGTGEAAASSHILEGPS
jgi:acetyl-CoA acetyltransferase